MRREEEGGRRKKKVEEGLVRSPEKRQVWLEYKNKETALCISFICKERFLIMRVV